MPQVRIQIVECLSEDYPGFVAAELTDAYGVVHTFHDKVPVFVRGDVDRQTELPFPGWLACEIVQRFLEHGCGLVRIDTEKPFDIESTAGTYYFVVAADTVIDQTGA